MSLEAKNKSRTRLPPVLRLRCQLALPASVAVPLPSSLSFWVRAAAHVPRGAQGAKILAPIADATLVAAKSSGVLLKSHPTMNGPFQDDVASPIVL